MPAKELFSMISPLRRMIHNSSIRDSNKIRKGLRLSKIPSLPSKNLRSRRTYHTKKSSPQKKKTIVLNNAAVRQRSTILKRNFGHQHQKVVMRSKTTTTATTTRRRIGRSTTNTTKNSSIPAFNSFKKAILQAARNNRASNKRQLSTVSTAHEIRAYITRMLSKARTIPLPRWISPKHNSITLSECFGHSSFILVAASYAVDDFLMLRCIAIVGSTSMLFFTYFHPHGRVLWLPFKWNMLFMLINSYRIGKVYLDRYNADNLSPQLMNTRDAHFPLMDPIDFKKLVSIGTIECLKKNETIVSQGEDNRYVRLVLSGKLKVLRDDEINYILEEGNFVAEIGLHAGLMLTGPVSSCCTIQADNNNDNIGSAGDDDDDVLVTTLKWDRTELVDLLNKNRGVYQSVKAILSWDIMRKLKAQRRLLASGKINNAEDWTKRRHEQSQHRYASILQNLLYCTPCTKSTRKEVINKYRMIHQIDEETHAEALKRFGWTPEEYETGIKDYHHNKEDDTDVGMIPQILKRKNTVIQDCNTNNNSGYLKDLYMRLIG